MNVVLARALAATAATIALTATLSACGGDAGSEVATDPAPTTATATPTPSPTATPTVGTYPAYPHPDYTYTMGMQCFCANIDQGYRITVVGGEVTDVTWATAGDGHQVGDPVNDDYLGVTIQDIIDRANDTEAAEVKVDWPAGQDYPNSVYVDQKKTMADEEITYLISDVEVA
jgi:Family of unknown function (DUF6174)